MPSSHEPPASGHAPQRSSVPASPGDAGRSPSRPRSGDAAGSGSAGSGSAGSGSAGSGSAGSGSGSAGSGHRQGSAGVRVDLRGALDAERLTALAGLVGLDLTVVEEIDSTNAALARIARDERSAADVALLGGRAATPGGVGDSAAPADAGPGGGPRGEGSAPRGEGSAAGGEAAGGSAAGGEAANGDAVGGGAVGGGAVGGVAVGVRYSGRVLVAERQTAGRGRLDRSWESRPGAGLTVSVLLRPTVTMARLGWLPMVVGTSLVSTVRRVGGVPAVLKWPNDVLVDGAKLAGILVEVVPVPMSAPAVVIGFGLNVMAERDELPERSTSLLLSGAAPAALDRTELLGTLLADLVRTIADWEADPERSRERYLEVCATVGRQVRVELPDGSAVLGTATDVDTDGRLVVDGRSYSAADVIHLR